MWITSPLRQNRKFDGYQFRDLTPAEVGQIAGRAGRHVRDGTFGVTVRSILLTRNWLSGWKRIISIR